MKNVKSKLIALSIATAMLVGCGDRVEVPPAHVGKILTRNGYAPETIPPSAFRLAPCWTYCDKLILMEAADTPVMESMQIFMPKDKLNVTVEVRAVLTVPTTEKIVNSIFDRVVSQTFNDGSQRISAEKIYSTYGQQAIRGIVRSEITKYSIEEVLGQREKVGANIHDAIVAKLTATNTPIQISRFELANIQPPKIIVNAQEATKKREVDIATANANAEVEMVEAEKALMIAQKNRLVEREKAETIADGNRIAAASITPQMLAYKKLEIAKEIYLALSKSNNVIIVPADSSGFDRTVDDSAVLAKLLKNNNVNLGGVKQ